MYLAKGNSQGCTSGIRNLNPNQAMILRIKELNKWYKSK